MKGTAADGKRGKRNIIIVFSVLVCILLVIAFIFFVYRSRHTFSQEKWLSNADECYKLVDSMLVYHLGAQYMDDMWLIISTDGGVVTEYCIDVT
jgi:flagellar basal body-associated protein FliL